MTNHLVHETSPYLLQHAENPVEWYPWGPEALEKARRQDRPIFLSIGYAACHWCHVMAHESFEDAATAAYMNAHFVNIKVDREERPDLDGIYMQAVVALTGQGGWPMSVFLTPDGTPFYGGTYYPPVRSYNLPGFSELLQAVAQAWEHDRPGLIESGQQILEQVRAQVGAPHADAPQAGAYTSPLQDTLEQADTRLAQSYDWTHGGWGRAPRFPQPMAIEYLLRRASRGERPALEMAVHALQAMAKGGMYDVVGGGFARYSTDELWRTPHFEKMLYDNAQLAAVYLHAWLVCRDAGLGHTAPLPSEINSLAPAFRRVCEHTLDFVLREMTHPLGGFYSSLDADSEGIEGKFYVWSPQEIRLALGSDLEADFIIAAYQVTEAGNFEGRNILQRSLSDAQLAERFNLEPEAVAGRLEGLHARLLARRAQRVRPGSDDKVLVSWNALMLAVLAEAGRYLHRPDYLAAAQRNARFLLEHLYPDGRLRRSWRARHAAYLEDYAALILGLLALNASDGNVEWYAAALRLADDMAAHYADPDGGFFDTRADAEALLYRPKELQDNATPSGSALAACALLQLAAYGDRLEARQTAEAMLASMQALMGRHPTAFAQWLCAADFALGPVDEVALLGEISHPGMEALLNALWQRYRPRQVTARSTYPPAPGSPALLRDRPLKDGLPTAYVCRGSVCLQPTNAPDELEGQLGKE
jgi:uncharacterized protein YyaL (SSP411 family)